MFDREKTKIKNREQKLTASYDREHDVLYVSIGKPIPSYSDEGKLRGVLIRRAMDNDKVSGVTIMDYSKRNKEVLKSYIPFRIDFNSLA